MQILCNTHENVKNHIKNLSRLCNILSKINFRLKNLDFSFNQLRAQHYTYDKNQTTLRRKKTL
jgi:hypothetical protein